MMWVVCLLIIWDGQVKNVYPGAKGQIMEWSEPNLHVDFNEFMRKNKVAANAYMVKVNSNSCTLITEENKNNFNLYGEVK